MQKVKKIRGWAVVSGGSVILEQIAYGAGGSIYTEYMLGVYPSKTRAERMRRRWKNADSWQTVKCEISYTLNIKK